MKELLIIGLCGVILLAVIIMVIIDVIADYQVFKEYGGEFPEDIHQLIG